MIPIKLQLKNFLSYGPEVQTIDFQPYNLICFSGKNGHGKSALLDAITWAIWGHARKPFGAAKADQGLLRLGQTNMMVSLDFYCNNNHYRIRREFTLRHAKPVAALDFGVIQENDHYVSLTEKTIRATQAKIESSIKLDFESFCNSAFLRQAGANEFSKKSPKDRKEILTKILGLQEYETIRKLALEKARHATIQIQQLNTLCQNIEKEIDQEKTINEQHIVTSKQLDDLEKKILEHTNLQQSLTQKKEGITQSLHAITTEQNSVKEKIEALHTLRQTLIVVRTEWRDAHKKKLTLTYTKEHESKFKELQKQCHTLQLKLQKGLSLKEHFLTLKSKLHNCEQEWQKNLLHQKESVHEHYHTVQAQLQNICTHYIQQLKLNCQHASEIQELQKQNIQHSMQLDTITKIERAYHTEKTIFEKRKEAYQRFSSEGNVRTTQRTALIHKKQLNCDTESPSCPLCEQTVSASRRRFLQQKLHQEEAFLSHRIARLTKLVTTLKPLIIEQKKTIDEQQAAMAPRSSLEKQVDRNKTKIDTLRITMQNMQTDIVSLYKKGQKLSAELTQIDQKRMQLIQQEKNGLLQNTQYIALKKEITSCEEQARALGYNAEEHKRKEKERDALGSQQEQYLIVLQEVSAQEERKRKIIQLCTELKQIKILQEKAVTLKKDRAEEEKKHTAIQTKEKEYNITIQSLRENKDLLMQQKGSLEAIQKTIAHHKKEALRIKKGITEQKQTQHEYVTIASAASKDGIQALLIEEVLPEIEYEANELLGRLTHNQSHIIIESLKDLKNGSTKETLDIFISDTLGIRPYELFSGGEAFRIDFALRIAISKLVARRAGTSLQTLIIDEGFGSQDSDGLGLIMDALYAIQDDFEKIIIVSHLPMMKEQFPVHFCIEKTAQGSNVTVMQQG